MKFCIIDFHLFVQGGKGYMKGKKKATNGVTEEVPEELFPSITQKLKTLDVFAGCGGNTGYYFDTLT